MKLFEKKVTRYELVRSFGDLLVTTGLKVNGDDSGLELNPNAAPDTVYGQLSMTRDLAVSLGNEFNLLLEHLGLEVVVDPGSPVTAHIAKKPLRVKVKGTSKKSKVPVRVKK